MTLKGKIFALVGRFDGKSHADLHKYIEKNGGTVAKSVTKKCTHVVCADKKSDQAKAAREKFEKKKKLLSERQLQNLAKKPLPKKSPKKVTSTRKRSVKKKAKKRTASKKRKSQAAKRPAKRRKTTKKRTSKKKTSKKRTSKKKKSTKKKSSKKKASTKKRTSKKKKSKRKAKKKTSRKRTKSKKRAKKRTSVKGKKKKKSTKKSSSPKKKAPKKKASPKKKSAPKKKRKSAPPALRRQISNPAQVDVVFSFDTTGSMMSVLRKVREEIVGSVERLFRENPDIKIGVIAHGDYCDGPNFLRKCDLTDDAKAVVKFVNEVPATGGGDAPEAYEAALKAGKEMDWREGASRAFVLIGDEIPHEPNYYANKDNLDWKKELKGMVEKGITIYSVQAYERGPNQKAFYSKCAKDTGGFHLKLEQFHHATNMLLAICFNEQGGSDAVQAFEKELQDKGEDDSGLRAIFNVILKRSGSDSALTDEKLHEVSDSKFEVLEVKKDCSIRDFVEKNKLKFKKGRGFYQFTKRELVQEKKEVVIQDTNTGDFYSGTYARKLIGLNPGERKKVSPDDYDDYNIYIQSTSYNRKLKAGTMFLYEKDE